MNKGQTLYDIMKSIPGGIVMLITLGAIIVGAVIFIKYNAMVLGWLGRLNKKLTSKLSGTVGSHMRVANKKFKRTAELNINSVYYTIYRYFDSIIVNTGMHREGVTVAGLMAFLAFLSIVSTAICLFVFDLAFLAIPALAVFFLLYLILFRYASLTRVEHNEEVIMDAIDLLVSDVKSGIFNSIIKYKDSFDESIRKFFIECIDNVQNKGYSFSAAMDILTDQLGYSFSDFASKAVYFESKREDGSEGIFGAIIELNRQRRILRRENAIAFRAIKTNLIVSFVMIFLFALYTGFTEPTISNILTNTIFGRLMIIADVGIIALVINYVTSIRARMI